MNVRKVLVVGGGIGGLTLAIGLRDRGIAVDMVELKAEWTVYGVGIIQQGNVVRAMAQLGIVDHYLAVSFPFEEVGIYDADGKQLALMPNARLAGPEYPANIGVSRRALHDVLMTLALQKGTHVRLGMSVTRIDQSDRDASVTFSDGTTGTYDVVVGADGVYSRVRALTFGRDFTPAFTGQGCWRHNFERLPEIDHLYASIGPQGNAGLCPLAPDLMYMYVTAEEPGNPDYAAADLPALMRDRLKAFGGIIGMLRDRISDPAEVVYRPFEALLMPAPWYRGRVVLIGDAAHTTTPHLGQGAGMAIEDSVVLSELLARDAPLADSFDEYMHRRYERCRYIVEESIAVGTFEMTRQPADFNHGMAVAAMLERTAQPI